MEYKFEYFTDEKREILIKQKESEGLYLIADENLITGKFLTFSGTPQFHEETTIEQLAEESKLLKAQNKVLTERTDFHEEVLAEIILAITP